MKRLLVAVAISAAAFAPSATSVASGFGWMAVADAQGQDDAAHPRNRAPVTFLQINDVYSTVPTDGLGGLARVATLKHQLARSGRTPFVVLAGDFLSPSVASSVFKGEQMVAALNAAGLDLATLGNHEFDFGDDVLLQRMREAKWQWVISNVVDTRTRRPVGGAAPYFMKTFGTLRVGFIGLVLTTSEIARDRLKHTRLLDPIAAAAKYIPALKAEGASIIVAVTHLAFDDDRRLAQRFPQIDLVIGGHEHFAIATTENRTFISKAGSDARWVARIDVNRRGPQLAERFYELIPITSAFPEEPRTAEVVASYETRLGAELDAVIAVARVPLEAETLRLRTSETNLGDLFADALRAESGAEVALVNSGGIRGDRVYDAGPLTRRALLAMHPFGNVVCEISVSGRVLLQALNSGVSKLPAAAGQFPQVSGLTMIVDRNAPPTDRVRDVKVNGQPLDAGKTYTLALPDFVLKGGDNYTMFGGQRVLIAPESGDLVVTALEKFVMKKQEITQQTDGRITIR